MPQPELITRHAEHTGNGFGAEIGNIAEIG